MSRILYHALFIALFIAVAESWFFKPKPEGTEWDKLSVTWGKFSGLPIKESVARELNWQKTASCNDANYFRGNRYVLNNDKSVMLLFDYKGKIAGIQYGILKSLAHNSGYNRSHWISDGDSLVITAYFVHPSVICDGKRKSTDYIGENLYIQLGPSIRNLLKIPFEESKIGSTKWVKGKCFWTMGQHYWYDISRNMKCEDFFPVFLLYNGDKLNGFGWALQGDVKSSRVEHPTPDKLHFFFEAATRPICLNTQGVLTTEHIYLQRRPYLNHC